MVPPPSSSQDVAEVRDVRESSAPRADRGNINIVEMNRMIRVI